jgi:D-alanyl-D-alanine carboxypeptidase
LKCLTLGYLTHVLTMKTTKLLFLSLATLLLSVSLVYAQDVPGGKDSASLLLEQVAQQPDDAAIGCVPLRSPANAVLYNADQGFPLASVSKLLIFIEYTRRLETGEIGYDEMVDVATLDRYNLPRTDRGAHDRFMAQYPAGVEQISLWELAFGMMQFSSNAASDYLLDRLAPINWDSLYAMLSVENTDYPHSLTMIPLLMNNHETGKATLDEIDSLSRSQGERYLDLYVQNEAWRQAEIEHRSGRGSQFPAWNVQTAILEQYTASGTVNDFLNVLRAIYTDDGALPERVKTQTRLSLIWSENEFITQRYFEYGSKLGFYSGGTLTLVAYGNPFGGMPVISVVFLRNIPRRAYSELLEEDAIGDFVHWMNFNGCRGLRDLLPAD